jgi:membrane fusion protein (multidrug efflux system)
MNRSEKERRPPWFVPERPVCLLACLSFILVCACERGRQTAAAPTPPEVSVAEAVVKDVPIVDEWVGAADGLVNATIRAQVTGYLIKQEYSEGDPIKKGDVLFTIDPRPFREALDQALGTLAQTEAQHENAHATLERVRTLASENALSKKDLDDAIGAERSTGSAVVSARAAVEKARLDLGFTRIISPIDGIAGIARAQVGDLVGPSQGGELATVSMIDPIKVYYTITEQAYLGMMKRFPSAAGRNRERKMDIELILGDGSSYPYRGKFYAIDRQIDVRTGTLRMAATFPNPRHLLRPGQFVRVRVRSGIRRGALLIPQRAVMEFQGSYQLAVVGPDNRVEMRQVRPGERVGALWVIDAGLNPGERVVAEGGGKVRQGTVVTPKPFVFPAAADPDSSANARGRTGAGGR